MPDAPDLTAGEFSLAAEFPAATRRDWQRLVARVLHGPTASPDGTADPERELATLTLDGIEISPLYTSDDATGGLGYPGQAPFVRGRTAGGHRLGWDIRGQYRHPDPAIAREQIMTDLDGGVSSLWLAAGEGSIPVAAIPDVLAEVYLDLATVVLDAGEHAGAAARLLLEEAGRRGVADGKLRAVLGIDPIGLLARTGLDTPMGDAAELAARCAADRPGVRAIVVDALPFHDAGGTDATELGCALAAGVEYLRALAEAGLPMAAAFGQLEFRYAATADQFATIAKLRAARRTWSRVGGRCGVSGEAAGQRQHAVSSWPMMTRRDPWNNILRGTLACFAASAGGADAITVLPFDAALGLPDALALRVARNTHALLAEESNVARVIDPAGGSWYVESLTEALAQRAWVWFQEIERAGGLRAAIRSGMVADRIAASRDARRESLAHRREAVTGVSEFPMIGETLLRRPAAGGQLQAGGHPQAEGHPLAGGLPRIRWAQWHEELRDRADAYTRSSGAPPTVALVLVGAPRAAAARAAEVTALLAPAGIAAAPAGSAPGAEPGPVSGDRVPPVAVVCCADDASEDDVTAAIARLRAAGASLVLLAAAPDSGAAAAADEFIAAGMDVLALQRRALDALEVPQ